MSNYKYSSKKSFEPTISNTPDLPAIDWSLIGAEAPKRVNSKINRLTKADAVVITWASAEWAALQQVFCSSESPMPYEDKSKSYWSGWHKFDVDLPDYSGWNFWCYYTMVKMNGKKVLLIKSNTHLDYPGVEYLEEFINKVCDYVKPKVLLSIGTAGGTRPEDHEGTVNVVNAGTLFPKGKPSSEWPTYSNKWKANWSTIEKPKFSKLLFPVPTTEKDLESLVKQYNAFYKESLTLAELNPGNVNMADPEPKLNNFTKEKMSLLTAESFVVGTTSGEYKDYAVIEMDDAIIGKVCNTHKVPFGFFRNISDPVQNKDLSSDNQANWGGAIYSTYGFYTSFNGALAAWAVLNSQLK